MSTRVLVVSARATFIEALLVGLQTSGLDCVATGRVEEAISLLAKGPMPSAVIVDLLSIPIGAAHICHAVRTGAEGEQVAVLLGGTGAQDIRSITDALVAGGDAYFQMPISVAKVIEKIATYVGCAVPELPITLMLHTGSGTLGEGEPTQVLGDIDASSRDAGQFIYLNEDFSLSSAPPSAMVGPRTEALAAPRPVSIVPRAIDGPREHSPLQATETPGPARTGPSANDPWALAPIEHADDASELMTAQALAHALALARAPAQRDVSTPSRLTALPLARAEAERMASEATRRTREEELRAGDLSMARASATRAAIRSLEEADRHRAEEARVEVVELQRREAARAAAEAQDVVLSREAEEQAHLVEVDTRREAAEAAAARAHSEAERRQRIEQARLNELEQRGHAAKAEAARAHDEAKRRQHEEQARIDELEQRRHAAQAEAARAHDEARRRQHEEQARIDELEQRRHAAEAEGARAHDEAERRQHEEQTRIDDLKQRRQETEAEAARAHDEAERRRREEQAHIEELERRRHAAEVDAVRAHKTAASLAAAEQTRLEELQRRHAEVESEVARAAEEGRQQALLAKAALEEAESRTTEVRRRLDEIGVARARAEQDARVAIDETQQRAQDLQARLLELERERIRVGEETRIAEEAHRRRADAERQRLLENIHAREQLEEAARADGEARRKREVEEAERLAAMVADRERVESELRAVVDLKHRELLLEEERLSALHRERAATELESFRKLEEQERLADIVEERLAQARRQRTQLAVQTQEEFEQLARTRSEHEFDRREVEERRTRARLAFQSGRLDALPSGTATGGIDVGSELRPSSDAEGDVVGGPSLPVVTSEVQAPPPPPFVTLEPPEGRFAEGELPSLLWACHHLGVTGSVELTFEGDLLHPDRARTIFFEEGEPVLVSSSLPIDRPEEALLRAGLVTAAKYNELRAGPLRSPRRTAAALAAEGVLKPEELFPAVRGVLTEQVMSLLEHEGGKYRYREAHAHAADRVRLEHQLDALIAEAIRRKYDERRLWLVLGGPASLLAPDDRGRLLPPLSSEEKLALARLDGSRALEDVIVETGIAAAVVLRTALIALSSGVVRLLARGVPLDPAERLAQRERSLAIDRARILDRLQAARHGDYFSFLGIDQHTAPFEVQRAAERLRQRFDPLRFSDPAFADLKAALKEIVEVSFDAEAVLSDEALADGYRRNLIGQRRQPTLKRRA